MGFKEQIQERTKKLAIEIVRYCDNLTPKEGVKIISRQLVRSSTSVAANYRSVCRAKSSADFINKLNIVEEEADESIFWMEMLKDLGYGQGEKTDELMHEMAEILAIVVTAKKTSKRNISSGNS